MGGYGGDKNQVLKTWMIGNQLKLNDNKTEALLFPFLSSLRPSTVSLPTRLLLALTTSLSLILPGTLESFLTQICQTAYFELKRIISIRRFLTEDAAKTCYFLYPLTARLLQLSPDRYT